MRSLSTTTLIRLITSFLFIAVVAGTWDAWWHGAVGRESLFEPPHLLLYASTIIAVLMGIYGWYTTRKKIWKRVALVLLLIPLSAPFDELWHRIFGVEDLSSPLIVWSPPHLAIIFALVASFISLLLLIRQDEDVLARRLFGSLSFAGIVNLLFFVVLPLQPAGPWELIGFWGAGVMAAILIGALFFHERLFPGIGSAFSFILPYLTVSSVAFGEKILPTVRIAPHDHPPSYVVVFAFLGTAVLFDVAKKMPRWLRGGLAGAMWSAVLYGLSTFYFKPEFQYGISEIIIAVGASTLLGGLVGLVLKYWERN